MTVICKVNLENEMENGSCQHQKRKPHLQKMFDQLSDTLVPAFADLSDMLLYGLKYLGILVPEVGVHGGYNIYTWIFRVFIYSKII